jgi:hypothetical protein
MMEVVYLRMEVVASYAFVGPYILMAPQGHSVCWLFFLRVIVVYDAMGRARTWRPRWWAVLSINEKPVFLNLVIQVFKTTWNSWIYKLLVDIGIYRNDIQKLQRQRLYMPKQYNKDNRSSPNLRHVITHNNEQTETGNNTDNTNDMK